MKSRAKLFMFALILGLVFIALGSIEALAKPPGLRNECLGKKIDNFNVILLPDGSNWSDSNASCNGSRIFFQNGGPGNMGTIDWLLDPEAHGVTITDCDGTDGDAEVLVDENQNFVFAVRVLGSQASNLDLVCTVVQNDTVTGNEDLCIVDGLKMLNKDKAFTKIGRNIADNEFENVLWEFDGDWKIFQVWLMEWDGTNCFNSNGQ